MGRGSEHRRKCGLILLSALIACGVFLFDLNVPLGAGGGILYLVAVVVSLRTKSPRCVLFCAVLCSVLVGIRLFVSPHYGTTEIWKVFSNRALALLAIWLIASFGLLPQPPERVSSEVWDESGSPIPRLTTLVLTILFCLALAGGMWYLSDLSSRLIRATALENAAHYSDTIKTFRTLCTSEVVAPFRTKGGVVTHDYEGQEGAIPLPATLTMILGKEISAAGSGGRTELYSKYPFPWRQAEGGLRDDFAREAWDELSRNPDKPFHRFEQVEGRPTLRYATADLMRPSCVACHNSHDQSPKKDWKIGDMRGVLEVTFPADTSIGRSNVELNGAFFCLTVVGVVGLGCLWFVNAGLRRLAVELESRVQARTAQLAAANEGMHEEITERKRIQEELEDSAKVIQELNADLERRVEQRTRDLAEANRELEAFSYSVSHDLRAPLRTIDGFSLALLEDHGGKLDEQGVHCLRRIRAGAKHMEELIAAALNLARAAANDIRCELVDLSQLAQMTIGQLRLEEPQRQVEVCIAEGLVVKGDPDLLEVALQNLLRNAWKFTAGRQCATIEFVAKQGEAERVYFVRDNGVGFDMTYADKLFVPFQRLHSPTEFQGTGIGLATVQRIIRRHHGRIWAEGKMGQGATFYFTLGRGSEQRSDDGKN